MLTFKHSPDEATIDDHVVRRPRTTDAIGNALRAVFDEHTLLPDDMLVALQRIDLATARLH